MVHPINELRKAREAGLEKARDPELAFVTRAELRAAIDEALAPVRAALEVSDLDAAIDELDGIAPLPDAVEGDATEREAPAVPHPAESEPEGHELVEKIHEKKSRTKRKPEGQDPLGLVPDPEGDDS
jgi:hypothetical protein